MGIINVTCDSFSKDGLLKSSRTKILNHAQRMISDGADILDVGGESTRPGAQQISLKEEIRRVIPIVEILAKKCSAPISVDTYKPEVARAALDAGAVIINNIMGTKVEKSLLGMIRDYKAALVLMHIKGTPATMQKNVRYGNIITEIKANLQKSVEKCLACGIKSDRIILDPGIGFGKTLAHNLTILNTLSSFASLKKPLLIGTSRKSFIGKTLNREVGDRLMGSAASVTASIFRGAHIVRVHDVSAMNDVALMSDAILNSHS